MNKAESIRDRIVLKTEAKSGTVLFNEGFKVVGLGFMAGQNLAQHSSPTETADSRVLLTKGV